LVLYVFLTFFLLAYRSLLTLALTARDSRNRFGVENTEQIPFQIIPDDFSVSNTMLTH